MLLLNFYFLPRIKLETKAQENCERGTQKPQPLPLRCALITSAQRGATIFSKMKQRLGNNCGQILLIELQKKMILLNKDKRNTIYQVEFSHCCDLTE